MTILIALSIGLFSGTLSGLFGVGGGVIIVPALVYFASMSINQAVAASLVIIVPTALLGAYQHKAALGGDLKLVSFVALGALIGVTLGSAISAAVGPDMLKKGFAIFVIFIGFHMLIK